MATPSLLTESSELALGGPKHYEAFFDVGYEQPVRCIVAQTKNRHASQAGKNRRSNMRWAAGVRLVSPAWLAGQSEDMPMLLNLSKEELSVRDLDSDATEDDIAFAAREDAKLLAEKAALVLGAVKTKKR